MRRAQYGVMAGGWRSHEEIVAWQLSTELKNRVYALIDADPRIQRDVRFRDHLEGAVSSAPPRVSEISCVGHSIRSLYAPQTETGEAERRDPGADRR